MRKINDYIIAIEVPKLAMPNLSSAKIKGPKNVYYMYPGRFTDTLLEINNIATKLINDTLYEGVIAPDQNSYFEKMKDSYSYILTETEIDMGKSPEDILEELRILFKPLLIIFSFLFSEIFNFNKVFFFSKQRFGYKFIRMLETTISHEDVSEGGELKRDISLNDVEVIFPFILARICGKEKYLEFIDGYLAGKIRSFYIGNKISNYWNCLEHFAQRYCKEKGKTRIMSRKVIKNLNKIVKGALNIVTQEAIEFPNLNLTQVLSKGLLLPYNNPPINDKITYMCYKKNIRISEDEEKIIKMIYEIRNKLYHEESYLTNLLGVLARKFGLTDPTLVDIAKFSKKFSLIVEKIILRFFKIIPNYFNVEQGEYHYYLNHKVMNLPSLLSRRQREKERLEERFDRSGLTSREVSIKSIINDKRDLCRRGKFISIIKFFSRFKAKLHDLTHVNYVSGVFRGSNRFLNVTVRFKGNLKGELEIPSRNLAEIAAIRRGEIYFQSDLMPSTNNFRMKFKLLLKRTTHSFNTNTTGEFLTFLNDINELV